MQFHKLNDENQNQNNVSSQNEVEALFGQKQNKIQNENLFKQNESENNNLFNFGNDQNEDIFKGQNFNQQQQQFQQGDQEEQKYEESDVLQKAMEVKKNKFRVEIRRKQNQNKLQKSREGKKEKIVFENSKEVNLFLENLLQQLRKNMSLLDLKQELEGLKSMIYNVSTCLEKFEQSLDLTQELKKYVEMSVQTDLNDMDNNALQVLELTLYGLNNLTMVTKNVEVLIPQIDNFVKIIKESSCIEVRREAASILGNMLADDEQLEHQISQKLNEDSFSTCVSEQTNNFCEDYINKLENSDEKKDFVLTLLRLVENLARSSEDLSVSGDILNLFYVVNRIASLESHIIDFEVQDSIISGTLYLVEYLDFEDKDEIFNKYNLFFANIIYWGTSEMRDDKESLNQQYESQMNLARIFELIGMNNENIIEQLVSFGVLDLVYVLFKHEDERAGEYALGLLSTVAVYGNFLSFSKIFECQQSDSDQLYFIRKIFEALQLTGSKSQEQAVLIINGLLSNGQVEQIDILSKYKILDIIQQELQVNWPVETLVNGIQCLQSLLYNEKIKNYDNNMVQRSDNKVAQQLQNDQHIVSLFEYLQQNHPDDRIYELLNQIVEEYFDYEE
ncbi:Armadillo-type fold [Pseudocohnilembus persalinus]|uniref:Armadillo-type fold n=1 Tax=Pseudocohnilembus persalinus TaxID=266149 RepID=A0A0V0R542_PSEPJ|nr:Armadillo-type fold [Pseudocohnilembus persalinus]|eukprot:KRX09601.1 Armadillo-type fold [Pseudocohnilembus persalinus]